MPSEYKLHVYKPPKKCLRTSRDFTVWQEWVAQFLHLRLIKESLELKAQWTLRKRWKGWPRPRWLKELSSRYKCSFTFVIIESVFHWLKFCRCWQLLELHFWYANRFPTKEWCSTIRMQTWHDTKEGRWYDQHDSFSQGLYSAKTNSCAEADWVSIYRLF